MLRIFSNVIWTYIDALTIGQCVTIVLFMIMVKYYLPHIIYILYRSRYDVNLDNHLSVRIKRWIFNLLTYTPYLGNQILKKQNKEVNKFRESLIKDRFKHVKVDRTDSALQDEPMDLELIRQKVIQVNKPNCITSKISGSIYTDLDKKSVCENLNNVMDLKSLWLNPTHPDIWPNLVQIEAELYKMCSDLFHAKSSNCMLTPGGTMSNIEALYTYRTMHPHIKYPNVVAPETAHSSFKKACKILKIQYRMCRVDSVTGKADIDSMERLIDRNTILLIASCPSFPHGIIDPINRISKLCIQYKKCLHVDACLGGFMLPFLSKETQESIGEVFDFRNESVTSISADLHKFGKMPKGLSMLMFKNYQIKKHLTFTDLNWTGGLYVMADFPGSRSGFLILIAWCMMKMIGKKAYQEITELLIRTKQEIENKIKTELSEDIYVVGSPKLSVFGIRSKKHNIHFIGDIMHKQHGWHFNSLPDGLHFCVTENNVTNEETSKMFVQQFITDLTISIKYAEEHADEASKSSSYKLYCSTQSIPDYADHISEEIGRMYIAVQNMAGNDDEIL